MRIYEALIRGLETLELNAAFGGAGENSTGMMLALKHSKKIRGIITKNEQAASFMACGYAMFTGRLGVCFATAGPGAFNLISGMAVALTDSYPLLAVSGYSTVAFDGRGALNETSGRRNTPSSKLIFDGVTKKGPGGRPANFLVTDPDALPQVLEDALNIAFDGRPGPVHIAIAEEITDPQIKVATYRAPVITRKVRTPDPVRLDAAAELIATTIRQGKNLVVLAGYGAIRSGANNALLDFIERFEVPLITTMDGKGVVDEHHRLAIGVFADSGHKAAWKVFQEANVVLAIGNSFAEHATFGFRDDLFEGRKLVHVNIDGVDIDKFYRSDVAIVADARLAIESLSAAVDKRLGAVRAKSWEPPEFEEEGVLKLSPQLHPGQMVQAVSKHLPADAVVLADAGAHAAWAGYYLELDRGQNFRKPGGFAPMGIGTNGAIGAKVAQPERTVVALVGDGSYLMSGFELMTCVEHNIPVIWVIFNDSEFKLIKIYQIASFHETGLVEFQNPDYAAYARACGAAGHTVDTIEGFEAAFVAATKSGRPTLIDAHITRLALPHYSSNPKGLAAALWERVTGALPI